MWPRETACAAESERINYPDAQRNLASPPSPLIDVPVLQRIARELDEMTQGVAMAHERTKIVADRLLGQRPEAPPVDTLRKAPNEAGEMEKLRIKLGELRANLNAVHEQLQRLESL